MRSHKQPQPLAYVTEMTFQTENSNDCLRGAH
jgi:hypothetical protein